MLPTHLRDLDLHTNTGSMRARRRPMRAIGPATTPSTRYRTRYATTAVRPHRTQPLSSVNLYTTAKHHPRQDRAEGYGTAGLTSKKSRRACGALPARGAGAPALRRFAPTRTPT